MNNHSDELKHYGVPGMKWGHKKSVYSRVSGAIRKRQMTNATKRLSDIKSKQKQVDDELKELNSYEKNPSRIGKTKISTAIRRGQINKLNKTKIDLDAKNKSTKEAIKELRDIDKYVKKKDAAKAEMSKAKMERLAKDNDRRVKAYGKNAVRVADAANIALTAYGTKTAVNVVKSIGKGTMKGIAQNPNIGNGALHTASVLTVAGMATVAALGAKRSYSLGRDIALTNQYDERQRIKKMAKKK